MRAAAKLALALMLLSPCVLAQTHDAEESATPAVVSAEALELGAALAEHADEELLDWAGDFVADQLRWHEPDLSHTVGFVEQAFPDGDSATHDAVTYLIVYLAYEDQRTLEVSFSRDLRSFADQARRLQEEMDLWRRYGVPSPSLAARPLDRADTGREIELKVTRLRELETKSTMRANQLRDIRRRVDFYLKLLNAAHAHLAEIPLESLASLHPAPASE